MAAMFGQFPANFRFFLALARIQGWHWKRLISARIQGWNWKRLISAGYRAGSRGCWSVPGYRKQDTGNRGGTEKCWSVPGYRTGNGRGGSLPWNMAHLFANKRLIKEDAYQYWHTVLEQKYSDHYWNTYLNTNRPIIAWIQGYNRAGWSVQKCSAETGTVPWYRLE